MEIAQINKIFHGVFRRGIYRSGDPRTPGGSGPFSGRIDGANRRGLPEARRTAAKHGDYDRSQPTRTQPRVARLEYAQSTPEPKNPTRPPQWFSASDPRGQHGMTHPLIPFALWPSG